MPDPEQLFEVLDATWPAARTFNSGPWRLRQGDGGGQRVSAATAEETFEDRDIDTAEAAMRDMDQRPLFMVRDEDDALDTALARRGYEVVDPVVMYIAPVADLTAELPVTAAMPSWPPLAVQLELWAKGGIGPARVAIMERCTCPKTSILGRAGDVPSGTAFAASDRDIAMLHAIEILPEMRRKGVGRHLINAAANWAARQSATWLALAVTRANDPANALYRAMGMSTAARYHYRRSTEAAE
jgi:GNAT superfamily N-acetyltransferase